MWDLTSERGRGGEGERGRGGNFGSRPPSALFRFDEMIFACSLFICFFARLPPSFLAEEKENALALLLFSRALPTMASPHPPPHRAGAANKINAVAATTPAAPHAAAAASYTTLEEAMTVALPPSAARTNAPTSEQHLVDVYALLTHCSVPRKTRGSGTKGLRERREERERNQKTEKGRLEREPKHGERMRTATTARRRRRRCA